MCKTRWHKFALAAVNGEVIVKLTMAKDKDRWECIHKTVLEFEYVEDISDVGYFKYSGCFDILYAHNSNDLCSITQGAICYWKSYAL